MKIGAGMTTFMKTVVYGQTLITLRFEFLVIEFIWDLEFCDLEFERYARPP